MRSGIAVSEGDLMAGRTTKTADARGDMYCAPESRCPNRAYSARGKLRRSLRMRFKGEFVRQASTCGGGKGERAIIKT